MTTFDDREKAFEAKFRLDQETEFKIAIRRDKLLGLWAAEQMGLTGDAAKSYALTVVDAEFSESDHDASHKVIRDFAAKGVPIDEAAVRHQKDRMFDLAGEQILGEIKGG
jgi:hypothetical protein